MASIQLSANTKMNG